ncbi:glycosyltransferase [Desulfopila sp. IMCC35006]|uniref:glycosyltransferase family 2 protein n=1 Tax=Desulfopila sp. IMCC35006 TaxID=2569542 RepID=UPI0010AD10D3|nr:glycosyltransferase [Desulfopila sp. IMCC35006]TKB23960.1 glycosyltransferase [Desulfopila sp. IMCC35006]
MNKIPEVSVVITCFNYGRYLEGCLCSVLAQTYEDYEIIVVDDGSTDNTPQIMTRFADVRNLVYIRQDNSGQANSKNKGIKNARGRYVAFLDADDLWEKDKLAKQVRLFENKAVGVVYSRARVIDKNGHSVTFNFSLQYLTPRSGMVSRWLLFDNFIPFSSSIVRKECIERLGAFDETLSMGIDWDLWLRISTQYEFDFVDESLFAYRIGHSDQMSKNAEERRKCSDRIMENFIMNYPDVITDANIRKVYSYTYCNRGSYNRKFDKKKSYRYFFRAILKDPFNIGAYKGIVKNIINYSGS